MDLDLPTLHGIVPPLPTPLLPDESIDEASLRRLIEHHISSGVHALWILGTTARFDLIPDDHQRQVAEIAADQAGGRVPLVLNVSDQGTLRTKRRARLFDDLPYDYYAALPPWYQLMAPGEVAGYFQSLADELERPVLIYNAPWVCNQLSFDALRKLAEHPRIAGCKDVCPSLTRPLDWPASERRQLGFSYLHGNDLIALSSELGSDGFVLSLSDPFPEIAVAAWESSRVGELETALRLQLQFTRLNQITSFGPMLACIEAACQTRGFLDQMLPSPLQPLSEAAAERVRGVIRAVGETPGAANPRKHRLADRPR